MIIAIDVERMLNYNKLISSIKDYKPRYKMISKKSMSEAEKTVLKTQLFVAYQQFKKVRQEDGN